MLRAGDRIGDRYEVIEKIAEGGMGTVWRAHHLELGVDVALKSLSVAHATPEAVKRFKREAQAAAKLRSPNIVQVLDYGVFQDQPYLAMELLRGEDLASRIARDGKLSPSDTVRILQGVATALSLAHEAEIVHRDIKPANILLERVGDQEVVKVLDFGIAKDLRPLAPAKGTTGTGMIGTPDYMSPEQVWGEAVGSRTDVWALGVVAFEMLTGCCPFTDDSLAKTFERIIRAPLPRVHDFEPTLPPGLDAFFERALARAPSDRIPTARALGEQLRAALDEAAPPASAHKVSPLAATLGAPAPFSLSPRGSASFGRELPPRPRWQRVGPWLGLLMVGGIAAAALLFRKESPGIRPDETAAATSTSPPAVLPSGGPVPAAPASATATAEASVKPPALIVPEASVTKAAHSAAAKRLPVPTEPKRRVDSTFGIAEGE